MTLAHPSSTSRTSAPPSSPLRTLATSALAQLDAMEAALDLDIVLPPNDRNQIAALNRVSDTALTLASDIVTADPLRFPDFTDLPAAATYVQIVGEVAARAEELATHLRKSIQKRRAPAANKTLTLYAVVKSLGRIVENETMRERVAALKVEIAPRRSVARPKMTKEQKAAKRSAQARAQRVEKATKLIEAAGGAVTTSAIK